jgi:hypothetical protein
MRTASIAVLLASACSHTTLRDPDLLAAKQRITYLGADFTRASIHDPLFDPGTFTVDRVQGWADLVTNTLRRTFPGILIDTARCDTANAAFVPEASIFDPRMWQPPDFDATTVTERIAPWVNERNDGIGLVVSLERVNAQDRLSALVILFERRTGRIALAERVRATLEGHDPFAAPSAYEFGAREESSLLGAEYRPHFEALGRQVAKLLATELGG